MMLYLTACSQKITSDSIVWSGLVLQHFNAFEFLLLELIVRMVGLLLWKLRERLDIETVTQETQYLLVVFSDPLSSLLLVRCSQL